MQDVSAGAVCGDLPGGQRGLYNGILPEGLGEIDMSYYYVYSTRSEIRNCEQEDDRETTTVLRLADRETTTCVWPGQTHTAYATRISRRIQRNPSPMV